MNADPSTLEDVEDDVADALERAEAGEELTAEDLERLRLALPVRPPEVARMVSRALPFPYSDIFEYVEGSERQSPYWRTSPDRSEPRSEADREARERFTRGTRAGPGTGTVDLGGREVPRSAARAALAQQGADAGVDGVEDLVDESRGRKALRRLRSVLNLE